MAKELVNFELCQKQLDLFQDGPVIIFKWFNDELWTIESIIGNISQLLGYSTEELIGSQVSYKKIIHPDDLERIISSNTRFSQQGGQGNQQSTYRLITRTGEIIWVHDHTVTILDDNHQITHYLGYLIDITERIHAEEELRESEKKYRSLLDNLQNAVLLHKLLPENFAPFSEVNAQACKLYGYSREEFQQLTALDLLPDSQHKDQDISNILTQLEQIGHLNFSSDNLKKSGECFPVLINSNVIELQNEKYILSTVQDLTEYKEAEKERELGNERFLTLLNSLDACIYVADMETYEILFMNESLINTFGQDFTGDICWKVFRDEKSPCSFCTNDALIDEMGQPTGLKIWEGQNPLSERYYINYDRAIRWTDGRLVRIQIATDITEMKSLETQLRQKYKMEAVGVMAGGMAHDFNNNLAIILGNIELSQMRIDDTSAVSSHLNSARTAVLRARDLVQQILTYSRQDEQEFKPLKLFTIIDETLKLLRSTIPTTVQIKTSIKSDNLTINADATQIQEVLINLCNNAVHAMNSQGVLEVELVSLYVDLADIPAQFNAQPGKFARLSVRDTGQGMLPEVLEKVFDPFFTTKDVGEGTGMGLAVVHGILESHGGFARVESCPAHGSLFSVYFPLTTALQAELSPEKENLPQGTERILYIDDEVMLADISSQILREYGYHVTTETNSLKALEQFQKAPEQFDLVITDQTMPQLTGKDLIDQLLAIRPDLPTIICTGHSHLVDEETANKAGVRAFCMKPLDMTELVKTVRRVLDQ